MFTEILKETKALFLIGLVDLLLTLILFNLFGFEASIEENGVFRSILAKSPVAFALLKTAGLLLCLSIVEFTREKNLISERVVKKYLKAGIISYLGLYGVFVFKINILPILPLF